MKNDTQKQTTTELKVGDASSFSEDEQKRASVAHITKISSILTVLVSGLALFSDGKVDDSSRPGVTR